MRLYNHQSLLLAPLVQLILLAACLIACSTSDRHHTTEEPMPPPPILAHAPAVRVESITQLQDFKQQSIVNGTLEAARQFEVKSEQGGLIKKLPISDGMMVRAGQVLLELDRRALDLELRRAETQLQEAVLKKKTLLIQYNGNPDQDSSVSATQLEFILANSGYNQARLQLDEVNFKLERSTIVAPFGGVIGDSETKQYQLIGTGQKICRLIDPSSFQVKFQLMENEVIGLRKGQVITVRPQANPDLQIKARVTAINPIVSDKGLVLVWARLDYHQRAALFEGMNVQVILEVTFADQVMVPKTAVSLRSGREVIFTYDELEGKVIWNYVKVLGENMDHVAIAEGLKVGDQVVWEGNLNLEHNASVTVRN